MPLTLLTETTSATASDEFEMRSYWEVPTSISASGLGAGEYVTLQYYDGVNWNDFYSNESATPERITEKNSMVTIISYGRWRGNKSATASPVAVKLHSRKYP